MKRNVEKAEERLAWLWPLHLIYSNGEYGTGADSLCELNVVEVSTEQPDVMNYSWACLKDQ